MAARRIDALVNAAIIGKQDAVGILITRSCVALSEADLGLNETSIPERMEMDR